MRLLRLPRCRRGMASPHLEGPAASLSRQRNNLARWALGRLQAMCRRRKCYCSPLSQIRLAACRKPPLSRLSRHRARRSAINWVMGRTAECNRFVRLFSRSRPPKPRRPRQRPRHGDRQLCFTVAVRQVELEFDLHHPYPIRLASPVANCGRPQIELGRCRGFVEFESCPIRELGGEK